MKCKSNQLIWQGQAYNARGQVTDYLLGDDYRTTKSWDSFGFPEQILTQTTGSSPNSIQNEGYDFDELKGNLLSRINHWPYDKTESFYYDNLNRLTNENVSGSTQLSTGFALNGNITQKSDIGTYTYGDAGPHAVTGLTNTIGNLLPDANQTVDYTAFSKASLISQGDYSYYITYGPDQERKIMKYLEWENNAWALKKTRYYILGNTEIEVDHQTGETRTLSYIGGKAIWEQTSYSGNHMYYLHKDYQGTTLAITDVNGNVTQRYAYDPWGRRRNPGTWRNLTASEIQQQDFLFARGYTGHEHLDEFGLINMNGRMYDPLLGRMLSPDNYVQAPDNSQSFNRYSYCLNNPLVYTDPSGEFWHIIIGAAVGGVYNWAAHGAEFTWEGFRYFGVGAVAGALSAGVGAGAGAALAGNTAAGGGFVAGFIGKAQISSTGFLAGAISGAAAGVTNGLIMGTGNGMLSGQSFIDALSESGLEQAYIQGFGGIAYGGLMGSIDAIRNHEDWLTGSTFQKARITDGHELISEDAANNILPEKGSVLLPCTDHPYSIEITAPKGWQITNGYQKWVYGHEDFPHIVTITGRNSQDVHFFLGTPLGGGYGARVVQPTRLLNNGHTVLFYPNQRNYSTLFWYLSLIR